MSIVIALHDNIIVYFELLDFMIIVLKRIIISLTKSYDYSCSGLGSGVPIPNIS